MGLEDSTVLLYPLLALSIVLLFSSLSLALVVFLRGARAKTSKPGAKVANHNQEFVIRHGQEVGQPGQSSKGKGGMDVTQGPQSAELPDLANQETVTYYFKSSESDCN